MNTTFKLTTIAAVAMVLTACGGGGGGGSSIASTPAQTDWTVGQASADKSVSSAVTTKYNNLSDVAVAHSQGWKGQGVSIISTTVNLSNASASSFQNEILTVSPLASVTNANNFTDNSVVGGGYVALGTSTSAFNQFQAGNYTTLDGVMVVGFSGGANNGKAGISAGTINRNYETVQQGNMVFFDNIATNGNPINDVRDKAAYLTGAGAIISSKFNNLTNVEVVKVMDQSRVPSGAFELRQALAPKGNLR